MIVKIARPTPDGTYAAQLTRLDIDAGTLVTGDHGQGKTENVKFICESALLHGYSAHWINANATLAAMQIPDPETPTLIIVDDLDRAIDWHGSGRVIDRILMLAATPGIALVVTAVSALAVPAEILRVLGNRIDLDQER